MHIVQKRFLEEQLKRTYILPVNQLHAIGTSKHFDFIARCSFKFSIKVFQLKSSFGPSKGLC